MPIEPRRVIVEAHADIGSTQERMRERIRAGDDVHGHVVRAERQLAGTGTRGRAWSSEAGGSYQTLAVRDAVRGDSGTGDASEHGSPRPLTAPGVSVAVGIGIAESFGAEGARLQVKWPNDLWYRGRKLGGILCESYRGWLLVGVGVNVANEPPAGGIALTGWPLERVHELVVAGVTGGLALWSSGASLRERFATVDALAGRRLEVRSGDRTVAGTADGVGRDGGLRLPGQLIRDGTVVSIGPESNGGSS